MKEPEALSTEDGDKYKREKLTKSSHSLCSTNNYRYFIAMTPTESVSQKKFTSLSTLV